VDCHPFYHSEDKNERPTPEVATSERLWLSGALGTACPARHHVALSCSGFDAVLARLRERGLEHHTNEVPQMNLRQISVTEPGGVLLEQNFRGD
jgi:hypothetical protein